MHVRDTLAIAEPVVLVAMELGSRWPAWKPDGALGLVVVKQQPRETPLAFAERVIRRMARLLPAKLQLKRAILALRSDDAPECSEARAMVLEAALHNLPESGDGEVQIRVDGASYTLPHATRSLSASGNASCYDLGVHAPA